MGIALATALNRTFVLPQLSCFCDAAAEGGQALKACRLPGREGAAFPVPCPASRLLRLGALRAAGAPPAGLPAPRIVEASEAAAAMTKLGAAAGAGGGGGGGGTAGPVRLELRPHARIAWPACAGPDKYVQPGVERPAACTEEDSAGGSTGGGGVPALLVPPSLNDTDLLPLLEPTVAEGGAAGARLIELVLDYVGQPWHAFGGFKCRGECAHRDVVQGWQGAD